MNFQPSARVDLGLEDAFSFLSLLPDWESCLELKIDIRKKKGKEKTVICTTVIMYIMTLKLSLR